MARPHASVRKAYYADLAVEAPDQTTVVFKLKNPMIKSGVKFHDSSPLTSEDIKASYDRIINPPRDVVPGLAGCREHRALVKFLRSA
jgi:ABC-type transport system substrate-binding protein